MVLAINHDSVEPLLTARTKSLGRARDKADSNSPATAALIKPPVSADAQAATTDTFTTAPVSLVPSAGYLKVPCGPMTITMDQMACSLSPEISTSPWALG